MKTQLIPNQEFVCFFLATEPPPECKFAWALGHFGFIVGIYNLSLRFREMGSVLGCFIVL
jgi:hypothetical protein